MITAEHRRYNRHLKALREMADLAFVACINARSKSLPTFASHYEDFYETFVCAMDALEKMRRLE